VEKLEQVREALQSVIDKHGETHSEPPFPKHRCGLSGFGQLGDTCPACDWLWEHPKEKWPCERVLNSLEEQPLEVRRAMQALTALDNLPVLQEGEVAVKFVPSAQGEYARSGWMIDYDCLQQVEKMARLMENGVSMEDVEAVIAALADCGYVHIQRREGE